MKRAATIIAAVLLAATAGVADELILKDGTKITGNIVGFEGDSFKVETSYGFALVKKEKVASIIISETKPLSPEKKSPAPPPAKSAQKEAAKPQPARQPPATIAAPAPAPATPVAGAPASAEKRTVQEEVSGTLYTNYTFGFRMYKPPGWRMIEDARRSLPMAVVAMGTVDESTLFIVGKEALRGPLEAHAAQTERSLREIYQDYRSLDESRTRVGGLPAIERKFRGTADGRVWSAVLISFARGSEMFTILAMTTAGSDLIQIQENVIARTIASVEFLKP
ncbi:MAG TPA: hypothetical protein VNL38_04030 [Candidatus Nitrosotenuis sp.]|nr:hypothetical protein [Candidatus Nitrosotenuis sp.]